MNVDLYSRPMKVFAVFVASVLSLGFGLKPALAEEACPASQRLKAAICPEARDEWQVQRGAAFVPVGSNEWCRVGMPFLDRTGSDYGPQLCKPAVSNLETV